jgi:hypothetical protein
MCPRNGAERRDQLPGASPELTSLCAWPVAPRLDHPWTGLPARLQPATKVSPKVSSPRPLLPTALFMLRGGLAPGPEQKPHSRTSPCLPLSTCNPLLRVGPVCSSFSGRPRLSSVAELRWSTDPRATETRWEALHGQIVIGRH